MQKHVHELSSISSEKQESSKHLWEGFQVLPLRATAIRAGQMTCVMPPQQRDDRHLTGVSNSLTAGNPQPHKSHSDILRNSEKVQ